MSISPPSTRERLTLPPPPRKRLTRRERRNRALRRFALRVLVVAAVLGAAAAAAVYLWPSPTLVPDDQALAAVGIARVGERLDGVTLHDRRGRAVPVDVRDGLITPARPVTPGERLTLEVRVRRSGWAGWLVGDHATVRRVLRAPAVHPRSHWLRVPEGAEVRIPYSGPVRVLAVGPRAARRTLPNAVRRVDPGIRVSGKASTGSVLVAAAPRTWERLPAPDRISWFPTGPGPQLRSRPADGGTLRPGDEISLTFADPVQDVLGARRPALVPAAKGRWDVTGGGHTLVFHPSGAGLALGSEVRVRLPHAAVLVEGARTRHLRTLRYDVAPASTLRLQQLLAQQGYLPLEWTPDGDDVAHTLAAQARAAVDAPVGHFAWRYGNVPASLAKLWYPGSWTTMTMGAVMALQAQQGLTIDGIAGPDVWSALMHNAIDGRHPATGYSYVWVHRSTPQSLTLWRNGGVVLSTPVNTGVPAAPTELGNFPVFLRLKVQTMTGTNPDGSHYSDPGIRWISYFHGGEGIHGFNRASYGTPQSVGCVELPISAAASVWPYTPIGTLVTILE